MTMTSKVKQRTKTKELDEIKDEPDESYEYSNKLLGELVKVPFCKELLFFSAAMILIPYLNFLQYFFYDRIVFLSRNS